MRQPLLVVEKWDDFQHYKERAPAWIKLYRRMVRNRDWRLLSPHASKLLIDCWMLAAECNTNGEITLTEEEFECDVRESVNDLTPYLYELQERGWITLGAIQKSMLKAV